MPWRHITYILIYLITYSLTPWSRVLLEKLNGPQLVKKFPTFYGTRRFITAFVSAHHLFLSWASSIQSMPPHPTSWRSILILSSLYAWVFQVVSFPQAWRHIGGSKGTPALTFAFGSRCRWVVKSKLRPLLPGENTGTKWKGGWVAPKTVWTFLERRKSLAGIRTPNCPARTLLSIYYAIPVRSKSGQQTLYITSQFCVTCTEFWSGLHGLQYWTSAIPLLHMEVQSSRVREHGVSLANKRLC